MAVERRGKNPRVHNARRGIRWWCWCRDDVRGRECLSKNLIKFVKIEVERREKILGWATRIGGSDGSVGLEVTLEVGSA